MEGPRFDELARSLASGRSRRTVLKMVLGLGGGLIGAGSLASTEAARRPKPTPRAPICPGQQVWDESAAACGCPSGEQCGSDCCPAEAQCCDNACCYGVCYGEELCCESPREWCAESGECCPDGWYCNAGCGCLPAGQCCANVDCPNEECSVGVCLQDGTCGLDFDCTTLGSAACCTIPGTFCFSDGACKPVAFVSTFTFHGEFDGIRYCEIWAYLGGFEPSTDYYVEGLQYYNGSIYQTIANTIRTNGYGDAQQYMGATVANGYGSVALRIDGVESMQVAVSC